MYFCIGIPYLYFFCSYSPYHCSLCVVVVDEQLAEHLSSGDDFVMVNDDADLQENNNNNNVVENEGM